MFKEIAVGKFTTTLFALLDYKPIVEAGMLFSFSLKSSFFSLAQVLFHACILSNFYLLLTEDLNAKMVALNKAVTEKAWPFTSEAEAALYHLVRSHVSVLVPKY